MAKARKILNRLEAVRSVRAVTGAMETVARSRFRKTHDLAASVRPYTRRLTDFVEDVIRRCGTRKLKHPLLTEHEDLKREILLAITTNRGLCGGYNANVQKLATERLEQLTELGYDMRLQVSGKKGIQHFKHRQFEIDVEYTHFTAMIDFDEVAKLADEYIAAFMDGHVGGVEVAYTQFVSSGRQSPAIAQILPLDDIEPVDDEQDDPGDSIEEYVSYDLLPSASEILDKLLPATVRLRLYQCFLDAAVSEQIARISAMHGANENADDMIKEMNLRYNRMRQSQITTELAEILGGRAGLEG